MSILFKKIFVSFAVLSVVVWSSGVSAFAETSTDSGEYPVPVVSASFNSGSTSAHITWAEITDERLVGYKVFFSETNTNPAYPGDGYIKWETDSNVTSYDYTHDYTCGTNYYFSVTARYYADDEEEKKLVSEQNSDEREIINVPGNAVTLNFACEVEECSGQNNIVANGSFEDPIVTDSELWQKMNSVPSWTIEKVSDNTATTLELHKGWSGNVAADALQYAELDGDESTRVIQNVTTVAGAQYKLYWSFAGRHEITAEQNQLAVEVNGVQVDTNGPVTATAPLAQINWLKDNYTFTANGSNTAIAFKDNGPNNTYGTFLDNVRLCKIADPEPKVTIKANKIVCDNEADIPDMIGIVKPIKDTTAQTIVNNSNGKCRFADDWDFQWGKSQILPDLLGNFVGKYSTGTSSGWYDFSSATGGDATLQVPAEVTVNVSDLPSGNRLWFREVLKDGYIPFSFPSLEFPKAPGGDFSAEFWCNNDVANHDNAEWIDVTPDTTYYCVAINTLDDEQENLCGNQRLDKGEECDGTADCTTTCETKHSQWCSALVGIFTSADYRNLEIFPDLNEVIDINHDGRRGFSDDLTLMTQWYTSDDDDSCHSQFDNDDGYNFNQENYLNIDWCAGLKQGITDFYGTTSSSPQFSKIFDLNHDGSIDLGDAGVLASLAFTGEQKDQAAACYLHYGFPAWPPTCPVIPHALTYNEPSACGPATCETGYHVAEGICVADPNPICSKETIVEHATSYSAHPTCSVTACESGYVLTGSSCVPASTPSYSGGGGGGYSAFNITNVQNSMIGSSANITWQTNRLSLTWMLYGTSTSYGSEYQGANYHTGHTLALENLLPNTTYHYQVRAKDASNNTVYDIDRTFTTAGIVPQVLGVKENACVPKIDSDIRGIMNFVTRSLIRSCGPEVYHVLGSNIFHIPNWQYLHDNYFAQRIYNVNDEVVAQYGQILTDDTSIKNKGKK
jgi:hypothetical protein